MSSPSPTQILPAVGMAVYEYNKQVRLWMDAIVTDSSQITGASVVLQPEANCCRHQDDDNEIRGSSRESDQEANKPRDKVSRRLAQNREAAKRSRLKKKAYIQELESSRSKLAHLQQELDKARNKGDTPPAIARAVNSGAATFEREYQLWVKEQDRQVNDLRAALQGHAGDMHLRVLVDSSLSHFDELFRMKAAAAEADVLFLISGMWKTSAERVLLWIGGFRPSLVLKVLSPQLEPLTEQQAMAVYNLQLSSQQAEDALSQGMDKLQQTLAETLAGGSSSSSGGGGDAAAAIAKLDALVSFVNQADHLRHQALQQMHRILTTRQAARGLLALGDYCRQLRALSSLWAAQPREP